MPQDEPTIQAGIDAASDGDTVLVADGSYLGTGNRDIDFQGKAITVKSENGPGACIIDCEANEPNPRRGFIFQSGEGPDGAIAAAADDYMVYWEHWPTEADAQRSAIPELAQTMKVAYHQRIPAYPLNKDLWEPFEGLRVKSGETFNFQFERWNES